MFEPRLDFFDLVQSISTAVDLVDRRLYHHHVRVAYIATSLCRVGYLNRKQENDVLVASLLHDIGAIHKDERLEFLKFNVGNVHKHAEIGYQLLKDFDLFEDPAAIIRFHHVPWEEGHGDCFFNQRVPLASHLLHLADRVDVLIDHHAGIYHQRPKIIQKIKEHTPSLFHPGVSGWFSRLAQRDEFWLDLASPNLPAILKTQVKQYEIELSHDVLASFSHLLSQLVDFQSRFTATHSSGVSATAEYLARLIGFSEKECQKIMVAGFLHDIGKLAIPTEILEKNGMLTEEEYDTIKSHSYHTAQILAPMKGIDEIVQWCSYHHERANGNGYPFRIVGANLSLAAGVLAAADIFTAVTEDRPYRKGIGKDGVLKIFHSLVEKGHLDNRVVRVLLEDYDAINAYRTKAQFFATQEYRKFLDRIEVFAQWVETRSPELLELESLDRGDILFHPTMICGELLSERILHVCHHLNAEKPIPLDDRLATNYRINGVLDLLERAFGNILNLLSDQAGATNGISLTNHEEGPYQCFVFSCNPSGTNTSWPHSSSPDEETPDLTTWAEKQRWQLRYAEKIIQIHQGSLDWVAQDGIVTSAHIRLPSIEPKVLIIDDDPVFLHLLDKKLESLGLSVMQAQDGETALQQLEKTLPHLILCDANLPGMDGFQIIAQLKERKSTSRIPIIMITADESIHTRSHAFQIGADDFITKPINPYDFSPRVMRFFG
ncbi:MAG: HD domain-containing protein [Magnetococcales bacterium]|nr:HD domain-containing protein [Magnetococcales bacterium]